MFGAHRILLIAAFAILASPLAAQQTSVGQVSSSTQQAPPDQTAAPTQQPAPELPPPTPEQQSAPAPVPPPFPPMSRAHPTHRWVNIEGHKARHVRHRSERRHRLAAANHHRKPPMSRRELRKCRNLTKKQLRRNHLCRALVLHEVRGANAHRHHHQHGHQHHHRAKTKQSRASSRRLHQSRRRHHSVSRHSS